MSAGGEVLGLEDACFVGCMSGKVLCKNPSQISGLYKGFGQGSGCTDATSIHGGADLMDGLQIIAKWECKIKYEDSRSIKSIPEKG